MPRTGTESLLKEVGIAHRHAWFENCRKCTGHGRSWLGPSAVNPRCGLPCWRLVFTSTVPCRPSTLTRRSNAHFSCLPFARIALYCGGRRLYCNLSVPVAPMQRRHIERVVSRLESPRLRPSGHAPGIHGDATPGALPALQKGGRDVPDHQPWRGTHRRRAIPASGVAHLRSANRTAPHFHAMFLLVS